MVDMFVQKWFVKSTEKIRRSKEKEKYSRIGVWRGIAMSVVESAVFGRQGMITTIGDAVAFWKSGVW